MFDLFTDGDCDVTPEVAAKYDYRVISMRDQPDPLMAVLPDPA